jgi:hypothetical protein
VALEFAAAFDGSGTTVLDLSGNGRNLDLTGSDGAQVTGGNPGNALGKTGAVMPVLPASVLAATETDDRTIMLDILGTGRSVWVIRWEDDGLGSGIWGVLALDGVTMQSRARRQSDTAAAGALTFGTSQAGTWHNLCLTYVRSTGVLSTYWDGAVVTSGVPAGWLAGQQLMLGAERINLAEWSATGASIDNLRIYSHALTAGEVAAIAGTPVSGAVNVTGTVTADVGGLTATAVGVRGVQATSTATLDALTGTVVGTRTVTAVATATLGGVTATMLSQRAVLGSVVATLGALNATVTVGGALPSTRLRASGREPATHASGREPREST